MMRKINSSVCQDMRDSVYWGGAGNITTFTVLAFIDMIVIFGNILIIAAVYHSIKLRNVTNLFIVSLACADLMVGVAVLPFSATMEVLKVWIFGDIWCSMWLAVDVWMCTASILNLCAISLDRYLAVTRPIKYPTIMSPRRAKLLVAIVWVLSFIICFPPLVGWKEKEDTNTTLSVNQTESNCTPSCNSTTIYVPEKNDNVPCQWTCELTSDTSYVIYSALGSFYIPTLVMLFFYWRIYLAAASTTKAINRGFRTTKSTKSSGSQPDEQRLTLRIHRGRGASEHNGSNGSPRGSDSRSPSKRDRIKISVSYPSTETLNTKCNNSLERTPSRCSQVSVHYANGQTQSQLCPSSKSTHLKVGVGGIGRSGSARRASRRSSCESQAAGDAVSLRELAPGNNEEKPRVMKMGKRNIKAQVKRIRMETKAAKTLGIIVGGFIMCWLPFFTVYVVQGFCGDCVNKVVFSILFWLGYCNSAINPCIYALFSKEFRFAFKKIICNCFFKQRANTLRRGSDGSQLTTSSQRYSGVPNLPTYHQADSTTNDGRLPGNRGARCGPSPGFSLEDSDGLGSETGLVHSQSDSR